MSAPELDPKVIKATQDALGKVITKPPLTEKLLKRPPFKYLHDIITSIVATNGYMKGLYTDDELIVDNIKDKDGKVAFLEKAIDFLGFMSENPLTVKASKVVAGLEPDKTNEFLQTLGKTVASKRDPSAAIKKVLAGEKPVSQKVKPVKSTIKPKPGNEAPSTKGKTTGNTVRKAKADSSKKPETKPKSPRNSSGDVNSKPPPPLTTTPKSNGPKPMPLTPKDSKDSPQPVSPKNSDIPSNEPLKDLDKESSKPGNTDDEPHVPTPRPRTGRRSSGVKGKIVPEVTVRPPTGAASQSERHQTQNQEHKYEEGNRDIEESDGQRPVRPTTARAAPPKVVTKREVQEENEAAEEERLRLLSAKPVENLITEKDVNDDDNDDVFIIDDGKGLGEDGDDPLVEGGGLLRNKLGTIEGKEGEKGSLVKQLMETKKELEGVKDGQPAMDPTAALQGMDRLAKRDMEKLRENIQSLTRLANPLGRILDYLQEDMDSMTTELQTWEDEYRENMERLEKEKVKKDPESESLLNQLTDLDRGIQEEMDKISLTKANLIRNEEKLKRMVEMVVEK